MVRSHGTGGASTLAPVSEPIPVPGWYAAMAGPPCVPVEDLVEERFPPPLVGAAARLGVFRGALIWLATGRAPLLGLFRNAPGTGTVLFLEALLPRGRRRLVLFEFIGRERARRPVRRAARRLRARLEGIAMRRCLAAAQVLTAFERERYATEHGLPAALFHHIPWPLSRTGADLPTEPPPSRRVVSSGRAYCDWATLLAAADGRGWDLTLICGAAEEAGLRRAAAGVAEVVAELPREEHDARLREAAVYALVLDAVAVSAGQVRLAAAVDAGAPVVATAVPALEGYAEEATAVLVPPRDPGALGQAVDRLLDDPEERRRLRETASRRARAWTYTEYFAAISRLLAELRAERAAQATGTP
jgi:hypothetical protein